MRRGIFGQSDPPSDRSRHLSGTRASSTHRTVPPPNRSRHLSSTRASSTYRTGPPSDRYPPPITRRASSTRCDRGRPLSTALPPGSSRDRSAPGQHQARPALIARRRADERALEINAHLGKEELRKKADDLLRRLDIRINDINGRVAQRDPSNRGVLYDNDNIYLQNQISKSPDHTQRFRTTDNHDNGQLRQETATVRHNHDNAQPRKHTTTQTLKARQLSRRARNDTQQRTTYKTIKHNASEADD